ncbi:Histone acetyltransferase [Fasciolopsis buskii]|uniref:Histone acetyltransferase n=1 Tax=Fasciolopsis buskii TaxID=27845 RepID=A0A8E0RSX1_9TREM|nr:Histone acetyltransferase [Fasciolopsis buski]
MQVDDGVFHGNEIINESYYVLRNPGSYHPALIIESRVNDAGGLEYFVHYKNLDKRLDEWVSPERIDFSRKFPSRPRSPDFVAIPDEGTSRRFTRNQKRRYVESCAQDSVSNNLYYFMIKLIISCSFEQIQRSEESFTMLS